MIRKTFHLAATISMLEIEIIGAMIVIQSLIPYWNNGSNPGYSTSDSALLSVSEKAEKDS